MKKFRRVFAMIGIILLLAMYGSTMVFALMDSPMADNLLMASIYCTIAVPILLYAIQLVARNLRKRNEKQDRPNEKQDRKP